MAETTTYEVIIIGAGPGGYVCAIKCAQLGLKTALVEKRDTLGGTCLNVGCVPAKSLLDSTEFYARAKESGAEHGLEFSSLSFNLKALMKRKEKVVQKLTGGVSQLMKLNKVDVLYGTGKLSGDKKVAVTDGDGKTRSISAPHIVIATGSKAAELPFLPFDGKKVISSTEAIALEEAPRKLLVVGAGAIGLEMGSVYARIGTEVEVIELMPEILPGYDTGTAKLLRRELKKQGLTIHLNTQISEMKQEKKGVKLLGKDGKGNPVDFSGDKVLVAVGRRPFYEGLGLEEAGVEIDEKSRRITVSEDYATSVQGIYAIGDVIKGPMLAHKAEEEGIALAEMLAGGAGHVNYDAVPAVVYTWPEAASVGLTEDELEKAEIPYKKGQFPFGANARALGMGEGSGQVKVLSHEKTDRILGVHIVGPWASDLIGEAVVAMEFGGSAEDVARTCHAHPTLSEGVKEAALGAYQRMIHAT